MNHIKPVHPEMTALLRRFPLPASKLEYWPMDVVKDGVVQDAYAGASHGEKLIIEFLLSVWDPDQDWTQHGYRTFNLAKAMGVWGKGLAVDAVASWMTEPYFP